MTSYRITWQRLGRHGGRDGSPAPAPVTIQAATDDELVNAVLKAARPHLASRCIETEINLTTGVGAIYGGFRTTGEFTIETLDGGDSRG